MDVHLSVLTSLSTVLVWLCFGLSSFGVALNIYAIKHDLPLMPTPLITMNILVLVVSMLALFAI